MNYKLIVGVAVAAFLAVVLLASVVKNDAGVSLLEEQLNPLLIEEPVTESSPAEKTPGDLMNEAVKPN